MFHFLKLCLAVVCMLFMSQLKAQSVDDAQPHYDELRVNPALYLSDVLEQAFMRAPMQASLQSRNVLASARAMRAGALLPASPAMNFTHQNDSVASNRGEREWHAELELPIWLPNQRDGRNKVAEASVSSLMRSRQSLKLQVAGLVREALWNIAYSDQFLTLTQNRLQFANRLNADVEKRYRAGELAKTDAMLAQQEVLNAEKEKLRAEAEVMHARHRYMVLTGLRELPASYAEKQSGLTDYSQSPIWLESESKLGLAETERDLAQIESRENLQFLVNARSIEGGFDAADNHSIGLKVRIPFGQEANAAPIKAAAEIAVGNAISEREALRLDLETAMHEAEHNLSVSRAELKLAEKQYAIAQESLRLAEKSFALGESDLVSLLRVQTQTYEIARVFSTRQVQVQWDIARYNQIVGVLP